MSDPYQVVYCNAKDVHHLRWAGEYASELININPWADGEFIAIVKVTPSRNGVNNSRFKSLFNDIKQHVPSLTCLTCDLSNVN